MCACVYVRTNERMNMASLVCENAVQSHRMGNDSADSCVNFTCLGDIVESKRISVSSENRKLDSASAVVASNDLVIVSYSFCLHSHSTTNFVRLFIACMSVSLSLCSCVCVCECECCVLVRGVIAVCAIFRFVHITHLLRYWCGGICFTFKCYYVQTIYLFTHLARFNSIFAYWQTHIAHAPTHARTRITRTSVRWQYSHFTCPIDDGCMCEVRLIRGGGRINNVRLWIRIFSRWRSVFVLLFTHIAQLSPLHFDRWLPSLWCTIRIPNFLRSILPI